MADTRSSIPTAQPSDNTPTTRLRSMLQGQLRALAVPQGSLPVDSAIPAAKPGQPLRLGDYLRAHGLISEDDLTSALAEQRQRIARGQPIALGDLLVERGLLTAQELVTVLMLQQIDRLPEPSAAPPLGELLVRAGLITAEQLASALVAQTQARQRGEALRLGEILIAAGALSQADLTMTLERQRRADS